MKLEYLALPLHLPDADLAGELGGGQAVPLQREGAVQGLLAATPNVIEGDLLGEAGRVKEVRPAGPALREWRHSQGRCPASGRAGLSHPGRQRKKSWARALQLRKEVYGQEGTSLNICRCVCVCVCVCETVGLQSLVDSVISHRWARAEGCDHQRLVWTIRQV